ncbi:uncharacterized protein PHACADRAFT_261377 [Phanerochaete carnosa HHB-10118-sp]|uniref:Uncharacterized protein n=1 Tax=Phanerochaete carnosa (strain HHB-10118-sp) TaxID=650164 RepID=K5VMT3_PHACS|nr:uncharacterized protein PHACADRAFT_261377 [Phanerochaete carnosa HHB-10118-sp]EKM52763.1 hypothetical protein PHACADRAFT_261377 [Phanerochaete carnosa HHB-10118-sp]
MAHRVARAVDSLPLVLAMLILSLSIHFLYRHSPTIHYTPKSRLLILDLGFVLFACGASVTCPPQS